MCVNLLVQAGADVNVIDNITCSTPLVMAAKGKYTNTIQLLLQAGTSVNTANSHHMSPIKVASEFGDKESVRLLIDTGADVNDSLKISALQIAAGNRHDECIKMLLQAGAVVNMQNAWGIMPLTNAAEMLHYKCMKVLIEAGADVNGVDFEGHMVLVDLSFAVGRRASSYTNAIQCTQLILKSGVKINKKDAFGQNALEWALIELYRDKSKKVSEKVAPMLFFVAGEKIHRKVEMFPDIGDSIFLKRDELLHSLPLSGCDFSLKHLCRKAIRKHLLQVDKHTNLFTRVTQLELPGHLPEYLVYDMSLDKEYKFDDQEDESDDGSSNDDIGDHNDTFDSSSHSEEDDDDDKSITTDDNIDDSDDDIWITTDDDIDDVSDDSADDYDNKITTTDDDSYEQ